ncbi:MAG: 6-hydroxymethylpterin diphosphokinase MptE-like protein [Candidatus Hydrothermarchaeales archaeon]
MERDRRSASLLNAFLKRPNLKRLEDLIKGKDVNIFGAGPSLERLGPIPEGVNIAADGACSFLMERGVVPDMVVTDLDGKIEDILEANKRGAIVILHAHGDNMNKIKRYAKEFTDLYGTTQIRPFGNLLNFGGFTDGDRAGFIAEHFKAGKISFYAMEFEEPPGRYSFTKPKDVQKKKKKLMWAKRLVEYLKENSEVEIHSS